MQEQSVRVTIGLPKGGDTLVLGGAFSLRSSPCDLEAPSRKLSVYTSGFLGLYVREHAGDMDPWLILSVNLEDPDAADATPHHTFLQQSEAVHPHTCRWFGPVPFDFLWKSASRLSFMKSSIPRRTMRDIWDSVGPPDGRGSWLSSRLLPRTTAGAIRSNRPLIQLWTPLL